MAAATTAVDFARDVFPLLQKHCFECHGSEKQKGGLRLDRAGINDETTLSPRLAASVVFTPRLSLRASLGLYTQSPGYEKSAQGDYVLDFTASTTASWVGEKAFGWKESTARPGPTWSRPRLRPATQDRSSSDSTGLAMPTCTTGTLASG